MRRFYCKNIPDLNKTGLISGKEVYHILVVNRLKTGDLIALTNGNGIMAEALIGNISGRKSDKRIHFMITKLNKITKKSLITLYIASTKKTIFEQILRQATEMGVAEITPVITEFSVTETKIKERHYSIIIEAIKQSGNPYMPILNEALTFSDALLHSQRHTKNFFGDINKSEERTEINPLSPLCPVKTESIALWIGPEGGFSEHEKQIFLDKYFQPLCVGSFILRMETALVACLAKIIENLKI